MIDLIIGDALHTIRGMGDSSVDCCVTSPPYWGLRDYGTGEWEGGDIKCDHQAPPTGGKTKGDTLCGTSNRDGYSSDGQYRTVCKKCGAIRIDKQIGIEETPEEYIQNLVQVFSEIQRALTDSGTCWLNLGDSYKSGKQLAGVPWRTALALQADGWILRQDIIWHKINSMPESVRDRCTKSHEHIFLLVKNKKYYWDQDAMKEPATTKVTTKIKFGGSKYGDSKDPKHQTKSGNIYKPTGTRNKRDVWILPTQPFKEAHFAVFPEKLITPCILAGCPENGIVLDPFMGAGTTGVVAKKHNRSFIGIDLNPDYVDMARKRIADSAGG